MKTWEEIKKKYTTDRSSMIKEIEREFVNDCFEAYETEGFSEIFWSPYDGFKTFLGQPFTVIGRMYEKGFGLENLPAWRIKFEDNTIIFAYPEEIIVKEMKDSGCPQEYLEKDRSEKAIKNWIEKIML